ncbi:MAG TPA: MipA/OmpV family protein [Xanthomonadaceae bacterium]|nr:MipA/OmpV family protein [Xanthomonadaceae bacterium]
MLRYALIASLLSPSLALAQSSGTDLLSKTKSDDDRWSLGVAARIKDSPYAGEGTNVRPLPLVTYEGDRFFWRGLSGGVHLVKGDTFALDAVLSGRFDGFDIEDLGRRELLANGLDADLLEDRDDGLDAGLAASWRGRAGELKIEALADVTDASGGYELSLDYGYALHWGRTTIVPGAGVTWMSKDLADYYYGILDEEVARGVTAYRPGSAVVPEVSVGFSRPLGRKWRIVGSVKYEFLPNEISDSPLLEPDTSGAARLSIGFARSF